MRKEVNAPDSWRPVDNLRRNRRLETVYRRRRIRLAAAVGALCLVVVGVSLGIAACGADERVDAQALLAGAAAAETRPLTTLGEAQPAFARLGDRNLILPIAAGDVTIIAYKPTGDERTVNLEPIGEQANANSLVRFFREIFSGDPLIRYHMLDGEGGSPTGSVLVGAPAGSLVTSPVSGVVRGVEEYRLFGRYDDVQIDIRPDGLSGVTISLMFISDPLVSIGETVTAGKTPLGRVRESPPELGAALARYTHGSGSHVHMTATEKPVD